jgi:hypothetical protein
MASTGQAISTSAANHMTFSGYDFTREKVGNVRTNLDDLADEFMSNHHGNRNGLLCPSVIIVDM